MTRLAHVVDVAPVLLGPLAYYHEAPADRGPESLLRCRTPRCGWRALVPTEQADAVAAEHLADPAAP